MRPLVRAPGFTGSRFSVTGEPGAVYGAGALSADCSQVTRKGPCPLPPTIRQLSLGRNPSLSWSLHFRAVSFYIVKLIRSCRIKVNWYFLHKSNFSSHSISLFLRKAPKYTIPALFADSQMRICSAFAWCSSSSRNLGWAMEISALVRWLRDLPRSLATPYSVTM